MSTNTPEGVKLAELLMIRQSRRFGHNRRVRGSGGFVSFPSWSSPQAERLTPKDCIHMGSFLQSQGWQNPRHLDRCLPACRYSVFIVRGPGLRSAPWRLNRCHTHTRARLNPSTVMKSHQSWNLAEHSEEPKQSPASDSLVFWPVFIIHLLLSLPGQFLPCGGWHRAQHQYRQGRQHPGR